MLLRFSVCVVFFIFVDLAVCQASAKDGNSSYYLNGKAGEYDVELVLSGKSQDTGDFNISVNNCKLEKSAEDGYSASRLSSGIWKKDGDSFALIGYDENMKKVEFGTITRSAASYRGLKSYTWKGKNINFIDFRSDFEGKSTKAKNVQLEITAMCSPELSVPDVVAVLLHPDKITEAKKYFKEKHWSFHKGTLITNMRNTNDYSVVVPVGTTQKAIEDLKTKDFVLDVNFETPELDPGLSFAYFAAGAIVSKDNTLSNLQDKLKSILNEAWGEASSKIVIGIRSENMFTLDFLGPVNNFASIAGLDGYWINITIELLADSIGDKDRLTANIREARIIRWPTDSNSKPPPRYGQKLECEEMGPTRNMDAPTAIVQKLMEKSIQMYNGSNIDIQRC